MESNDTNTIGALHLSSVGPPADLDLYTSHAVITSSSGSSMHTVNNSVSNNNQNSSASHAHVHFLNQPSQTIDSPSHMDSETLIDPSSVLNNPSAASMMGVAASNSSNGPNTGTLRNSAAYIRS